MRQDRSRIRQDEFNLDDVCCRRGFVKARPIDLYGLRRRQIERLAFDGVIVGIRIGKILLVENQFKTGGVTDAEMWVNDRRD